jgi:hypothetical protein
MANITLTGILLDSLGDVDVGAIVTFTHLTTTGQTIATTQSDLIIAPNGAYSITLEYGEIRIDYTTRYTERFVGTVIVNGDTTATSLPELLNAAVPVTPAVILQMQGILSDAQAAAVASESFANQLTTIGLVASTVVFASNTNILTAGYLTSVDGGRGSWVQNGITGQTPSQSPLQLNDRLLNDANGNQWFMALDNTLEFDTFAELQLSNIGNVYQRFIVRDRGNSEYVLQPSAYTALTGDATLANGSVAKLQIDIIQRSLNTFLRYVNSDGGSKSQPVYLIGDSITEGTLASNFSQNSYAALIRKTFNKTYNNRNYGFANFDFDVAQAQTDPHTLTRSGFAGSSFNNSYFGGVMLQSAAAGEFIEISYTGKDFFVVYGQQAGGGLIDVTIDGVLVGTINTAVIPTQKVSGSIASGNGTFSGELIVSKWGDHVVRLAANSASTIRLIGMAYYEDVATSLYKPTVFNVGRSSIALSDIADDVLQAYASSGTIVLSLGVNDDILTKPVATFKAKLDTLFTAISAVDGGVIANDFIFSKPPTNVYKLALKEKCNEYNVPYFDFADLWFGSTTSNQYADLLAADGVHPSDAGHLNIARTLTDAIKLPLNTEFREKREVVLMTGGLASLAGYEPVRSFRQGETVQINGSVTNSTGSIIPENTLLGTLVVDHRVKQILLLPILTASGLGGVEIRPNGGIYTAFGYPIAIGDYIGLTMSFIIDETA